MQLIGGHEPETKAGGKEERIRQLLRPHQVTLQLFRKIRDDQIMRDLGMNNS